MKAWENVTYAERGCILVNSISPLFLGPEFGTRIGI